MTKITYENIEAWYQKHREVHSDAIPWDLVLYYKINGAGMFNKPLKIWEWSRLMKAAPNTCIKWLPMIQEYIDRDAVLNEGQADAIVKSNLKKQKGSL